MYYSTFAHLRDDYAPPITARQGAPKPRPRRWIRPLRAGLRPRGAVRTECRAAGRV